MSANVTQRRRSPRLKTRLRVQVMGVDEDLRATDADISLGGLYMDTDRDIGELGSVQRLRLGLMDEPVQLTVLARIARVSTVSDFWRGQVIEGVAFQFMFEETAAHGGPPETIAVEKSTRLREFVRALARGADERHPRLDHIWQATLESSQGAERTATVNGVSLQGTVLETDFPVPVGELIRVEIAWAGERIPLSGFAVDSQAVPGSDPKRYRTTVSFAPRVPADDEDDDKDRSSGGSIQEAFGALLSTTDSTSPERWPDARRQHLAGDLARVSLPSVLTVCELEHATGILRLRGLVDEVRCYLREGRLLDVERVGAAPMDPPEAALAPVLAWTGGAFEFLFEPVTRPDRIGMSSGAVLLRLAHILDESRR
jgi:hypothetical protein